MRTSNLFSPLLVAFAAMIFYSGVSGQGSTDVAEPQVCFDCHSDIEDETTLKYVHTALASGKCSSCHNPHASKHARLMAGEVGELCVSCHTDIVDSAAKPLAHLPAAEGACLDCHDPHASTEPNQLNREMMSLCSGCHSQVLDWRKQTVIHSPVADGECNTCHDPHGSSHESLLASAVPEICSNCHETDQAFVSTHGAAEIAESNCIACHDPHAASGKALIRANQHAPFKAGNCAVCHESDSASPYAVQDKPERLCGRCHRNIGKSDGTNATAYRHSSDRESYCLDCHNPHTSNVKNLLAAKQDLLCMRCHFNSEEYDKEQSEYITHPGQDCSTCHTPHAAGNPKFLASTGSDLCASCHVRAHDVSHPIGEGIIDPRDNQQMTCLDCHKMHGSNFEFYLPLNPTRDLCLQCHKPGK